jgi:excisionase family DNA binding protein
MKKRKMRRVKTKTAQPSAQRKPPLGPRSANGRDDALLTLTEAAFRLGRVHRTTIMRWVKEGRLKCVRLSRKAILFETVELDRFIREHRYSGD